LILTGNEIKKRLGGDILIEPFNEEFLNPNSYNLSLSTKVKVYDHFPLDARKNNPTKLVEIPEEGLLLEPGCLYLAVTNEYTETRNLVPRIDGRSSIGRLGIFVHVTAGFGDVGFKGFWTLELACLHPVIIYPNMRICQISYHEICGEPVLEYRGRYQDSSTQEPVASRFHEP
jgi:dCTP deaminase